MARGFSLFTPLVGTAIVIMTIVVAAAVVQNDVRLSRSLSASYSASSQATLAKLIKAAAEIRVLENMEKALADFLGRSAGHSVTCDSQAECSSKMISYFTATPNNLITQLTLTGLFAGMTEEVDIITGYGKDNLDDTLNQRINTMVANRQAAFTTSFSGSKLTITINSALLRQYEQDFMVDFKDGKGNSIQLSVVPSAFSAASTEPIKDFATSTKEAFVFLLTDKSRDLKQNFTTTAKANLKLPYCKGAKAYLDANGKVSVTAEWKLDSGATFTMTYRQKNYVAPAGGCSYNPSTKAASAIGVLPC